MARSFGLTVRAIRRRLAPLAASTLVALAPSAAGAATVNLSGGTLGVSIGALPPITVAKTGPAVPVFVSSGAGSFVEPTGVFGPATLPLPRSLFTGVPQISGLTLAAFGNSTKVVSCGGTGPCTGVGGLNGVAVINIIQLINLSIPLSVVGSPGGVGQVQAGSIQITVLGQGWTTGTALVTAVTTTTPGTAVLTQVTQVGSDSRTALHAGQITLVSGFQAITNVAGTLPGFAVQTLVFHATPEAGTLLLLGAGAGALAIVGWRRRTKR